MDKEFEYIEIVLENMEVVRLQPDVIYHFDLIGIHKNYIQYRNRIIESKYCSQFRITIKSNANVFESYPDDDFRAYRQSENDLPFNRIIFGKDIVSIVIHYTDGTEDNIYVPWNPDNDYVNSLQTYFQSDDYLDISINDGK